MKAIKAIEKAFKDFSYNSGCGCCGDFEGKVKVRADFKRALKALRAEIKATTTKGVRS